MVSSLTGCLAVGPDYVPPESDVPETWGSALPTGVSCGPLNQEALSQWWTTLQDDHLTRLIRRAVSASLDLRAAAARVHEARAQRGISASARFPTIDAAGSMIRQRTSESLLSEIEVPEPLAETVDDAISPRNTLYDAAFDASWELDIFGRVRRQVESADAALDASGEDYRDVLVTLLAEVALNYVEVRLAQTRLTIAEANRDAQAKTRELVQARFDAGEVSRLDVERATTNLQMTSSRIPALQVELAHAESRLALLLGEPPGALREELSAPAPVPVAPPDVAIGVPADVLRRRPDVRRSERQLAAQTARVGVATADLYPTLSLFGSIGLESLHSGDFLSSDSHQYSFGPSVRWNIFDAGRIRRNIEVEDARVEQTLIAYEASVLSALRDVEDALSAYGNEQIRQRSLRRAEEAAQRASEIARDLYQEGESDYLDVLDAERSLLQTQDEAAASNARVTTNVIRLYKALGGGWVALVPE